MMENKSNSLSFWFYLLLTTLIVILFIVVAVVLLLVFNRYDSVDLYLLLSEIMIIPLVGFIVWLIDKGSSGVNRKIAVRLIGVAPGMYYGFLVGSELREIPSNQIYGLGLFFAIFLLGGFSGYVLGPMLGRWITKMLSIEAEIP
jgi:hypothetical protein